MGHESTERDIYVVCLQMVTDILLTTCIVIFVVGHLLAELHCCLTHEINSWLLCSFKIFICVLLSDGAVSFVSYENCCNHTLCFISAWNVYNKLFNALQSWLKMPL